MGKQDKLLTNICKNQNIHQTWATYKPNNTLFPNSERASLRAEEPYNTVSASVAIQRAIDELVRRGTLFGERGRGNV